MIFGIFDHLETTTFSMEKHSTGRGFTTPCSTPVRIAIGQGYFADQEFTMYGPVPILTFKAGWHSRIREPCRQVIRTKPVSLPEMDVKCTHTVISGNNLNDRIR
jgi:hypothetical protein